MKKYTYRFEDGTVSTVEVSDELFDELIKQDKEIARMDYNFHRHNISQSEFTFEGTVFIDYEADPALIFENKEKKEIIQAAIQTLTNEEQQIIELYFWDRKNQAEISKILGVQQPAVSKRLERILEKLKKLLGDME